MSQLAAISNPPLSILVESAACDERATVEACAGGHQQTLRRLATTGRQPRTSDASRHQVSQLSAALAEQRRVFPTSSYPWLSSVDAQNGPRSRQMSTEDHLVARTALRRNHGPGWQCELSRRPQFLRPRPHSPNRSNAAFAGTTTSQFSDRPQLEQTFTSFPSSSANGGVTPLQPVPLRRKPAEKDGRGQTPENPLRHESMPLKQGEVAHLPETDEDQAPANSPLTIPTRQDPTIQFYDQLRRCRGPRVGDHANPACVAFRLRHLQHPRTTRALAAPPAATSTAMSNSVGRPRFQTPFTGTCPAVPVDRRRPLAHRRHRPQAAGRRSTGPGYFCSATTMTPTSASWPSP